ncbi:MAG: general secretion pathway protein GspK [Candidatus Omnitrophota bacterium]
MKLKKSRRNKASILIMVLWSVSFLTTLAVILGFQVRQKLVLVKRLEERDNGRLIAEAGVKRAIAELVVEKEEDFDNLTQKWSNNPVVFREAAVGGGKFSVSYEINSGETFYGLTDEESKININSADAQVMERLFRLAGLEEFEAQDLAFSIIDWRDADSQLSSPSGGAEDSYYRMLPASYEAKDAPFQALDEVLLVKGASENIFPKIRKYITIYGNGRVNINTAGKQVLMSLGFSENVADRIIAFRNGKDGIAGSPDDNYFENTADIALKIGDAGNLSQAEQAQINNITGEGLVSVKSANFMARSRVFMVRDKFVYEAVAVINRKGKILYWNES